MVVELEDDVEDLEDSQILYDERFLAVEEDIESVENAVFGKTSMSSECDRCSIYMTFGPKTFNYSVTYFLVSKNPITDLNPRIDTLEVSVATQQVDLDILNVTAISQGKAILDLQDTSNELTDAIINLGMDLSDLEAQLNGKVIFERYFIFTLPEIKKNNKKNPGFFFQFVFSVLVSVGFHAVMGENLTCNEDIRLQFVHVRSNIGNK